MSPGPSEDVVARGSCRRRVRRTTAFLGVLDACTREGIRPDYLNPRPAGCLQRIGRLTSRRRDRSKPSWVDSGLLIPSGSPHLAASFRGDSAQTGLRSIRATPATQRRFTFVPRRVREAVSGRHSHSTGVRYWQVLARLLRRQPPPGVFRPGIPVCRFLCQSASSCFSGERPVERSTLAGDPFSALAALPAASRRTMLHGFDYR